MLVKPGDVLDLSVSSVNSAGDGVARLGDFVVFVPRSLPGETVKVAISVVKKTYARARLLEVLTPSGSRVEPLCPIFGRCGGCQLQHVSYKAQLEVKTGIVSDALRRIGGLSSEMLMDCQGSPKQFGYRNKAIVPVRRQGAGGVIGFYEPLSHRVVPLKMDCPVMSDTVNTVLRGAMDFLMPRIYKGILPPYGEGMNPSGLLRELVIRSGERTEDVLLSLVMRDKPRGSARAEVERLWGLMKGIGVAGLSVFRNRSDVNFVWDGSFVWGQGQSKVRDILGGLTLQYDVTSFFQVNTSQAEAMFYYVRDLVDSIGADHVLELYCGVGSLTCLLAQSGHRVTAVEEWPYAVEQLRMNLEVNGLSSMVRPVLGSAETVIGDLDEVFDVVVLDPPRGGCHSAVLDVIIDSKVGHVVYVSCNPATLSRDLRVLADGGYSIVSVKPFDMFPQTSHVECVALIERK